MGVIGYYGSKIGDEAAPPLQINTDAPIVESPVAEMVVESSTPRDFQVVVRTGICTTVEFEWEGPGSNGTDTIDTCVSAHILSPPPEHRLEPDSEYLLTATFTSEEGGQSSFEHVVATVAES
ncbi:MAG: hypothetical protein R2710_21530 [Acidimicrobiales bacterium]